MARKNILILLIVLVIISLIILINSNSQNNRLAYIWQYYIVGNHQISNIPEEYSGVFRTWTSVGELEEETLVKNGKKVGFRRGFEFDGSIVFIENYDNNSKEHGEFKYYYPNGKLAQVINYSHGTLHGERIFYGSIPPDIALFNDWYACPKNVNYLLYKNGELILSKKIEYSNEIGWKNKYFMKGQYLIFVKKKSSTN